MKATTSRGNFCSFYRLEMVRVGDKRNFVDLMKTQKVFRWKMLSKEFQKIELKRCLKWRLTNEVNGKVISSRNC
jgi:hypothetical protein